MDAEQQIIVLLTEQNELLKKHLLRFRFSLLTMLVLTTLTCCGLGFIIYSQQIRPVAASRVVRGGANSAAPTFSALLPVGTRVTAGEVIATFPPTPLLRQVQAPDGTLRFQPDPTNP